MTLLWMHDRHFWPGQAKICWFAIFLKRMPVIMGITDSSTDDVKNPIYFLWLEISTHSEIPNDLRPIRFLLSQQLHFRNWNFASLYASIKNNKRAFWKNDRPISMGLLSSAIKFVLHLFRSLTHSNNDRWIWRCHLLNCLPHRVTFVFSFAATYLQFASHRYRNLLIIFLSSPNWRSAVI